jgi:hypothetical protein
MFATQANLVRLVQIASLLKVPFLTEVSSPENQPLPPKVLCTTSVLKELLGLSYLVSVLHLGSERRISYLEQFTEETWLHLVFVAKNGTFENVDFCHF